MSKIVVCLNNECTASGYYYEMTQNMWDFISNLTERQFSHAMPSQPVEINDNESIEYKDAMIALAKKNGFSGADLEIECVEMPCKWFDSGWI